MVSPVLIPGLPVPSAEKTLELSDQDCLISSPNIAASGWGSLPLGTPIPPDSLHSLSVSLPTWEANVGWACGEVGTVDKMRTGYPRFFVHRSIESVAELVLSRLEIKKASREQSEPLRGMVFPTARTADVTLRYMEKYSSPSPGYSVPYVVRLTILAASCDCAENGDDTGLGGTGSRELPIHMVVFPTSSWKLAKSCWQHAGMGISSRYAHRCHHLLSHADVEIETINVDYVPKGIPSAADAKTVLRERVALLISTDTECTPEFPPSRVLGLSSYNGTIAPPPLPVRVTAESVYLYPLGMSAVWHAHDLVLRIFSKESKPRKSVCFGFLYTDTFKIMQKWQPEGGLSEPVFLGGHPDDNLANLEALLNAPNEAVPISAVFCEFPSNPLLHSPNLVRLRRLADQYGFLIVVDDTIGSFVNVDMLGRGVDVVCTSMSKLFSGKADVMGGSIVLNPQSSYYASLKAQLDETYVDDWYHADARVMELNSRDFAERVKKIDEVAFDVATFLKERSLMNQDLTPKAGTRKAIKEVFYPAWTTRENYDLCRRHRFQPTQPSAQTSESLSAEPNFGPLLSLTFTSPIAAQKFYNALPCAKGPSLGTNFTLACPYTILAHYNELEWAAGYGVDEWIVRISVGCEEEEKEKGTVRRWVEEALNFAEKDCDS